MTSAAVDQVHVDGVRSFDGYRFPIDSTLPRLLDKDANRALLVPGQVGACGVKMFRLREESPPTSGPKRRTCFTAPVHVDQQIKRVRDSLALLGWLIL
jgi:hypothetical protein